MGMDEMPWVWVCDHRIYKGKNGYWDLSDDKKRTLDDSDVDKLHHMHETKRTCIRFHKDELVRNYCEEETVCRAELIKFKKNQSEIDEWFLYRLTQDVNISPKTYSQAIVVASSEAEAKFIHPSGKRRGWWARTTYTENARHWNLYHPDEPMPGWYLLGMGDEWVHPCYVQVEMISSFDGPKGMRNTCICLQ